MANKAKSSSVPFEIDAEKEAITYQWLIKELDQELDNGWVDAIGSENTSNGLEIGSGTWVTEENDDALCDYVDEVSDILYSGEIDNLDW